MSGWLAGQFLSDAKQRLVQSKPRIHTDHHQVQRVRQALADAVSPVCRLPLQPHVRHQIPDGAQRHNPKERGRVQKTAQYRSRQRHQKLRRKEDVDTVAGVDARRNQPFLQLWVFGQPHANTQSGRDADQPVLDPFFVADRAPVHPRARHYVQDALRLGRRTEQVRRKQKRNHAKCDQRQQHVEDDSHRPYTSIPLMICRMAMAPVNRRPIPR